MQRLTPAASPNRPSVWARRLFRIEARELAATLWSFAYFFCLLSAYFVLRPVREAMGIEGGVKDLPWLFLATFGAMLGAMPLYWALVSRFPRRVFIPVVYHFFTVNLLLFYLALMSRPEHVVVTGRVFFVWVSVFNLMAVTVFWSFMADIFTNEQGRRLFGFIAGGGSLGALFGSLLTSVLTVRIGYPHLLLISAALLEAAVICMGRVGRRAPRRAGAEAAVLDRKPIGGGLVSGFLAIVESPYLLAICGYMLLATYTGTVLYFAQGTIVSEAIQDTDERVRLFSWINFAVQSLTLVLQIFVAARIIRAIGVGFTLIILPLVYAAGFSTLAAAPTLAVVVVFQVLRRGTAYGVAKPTKETLFTLVGDEEKYKSKSFIDTVVFRGGDALAGWLFAGLRGLGLSLGAVSVVTLPVAGVWVWLGLFLGRKQRERRRRQQGFRDEG